MSSSFRGFAPLKDEFQVNPVSIGNQLSPSLTSLVDGGFVQVWRSAGQEGAASAIFGQVFNALGEPIGDAISVSQGLDDTQAPFVSALDNGGFAVVWKSNTQDSPLGGILLRQYGSDGLASGEAFEVSVPSQTIKNAPEFIQSADGSVTVVWQSLDQDGSNWGVFGRHLDASRTLSGDEFQINGSSQNAQDAPVIISLSEGGQLVAWASVVSDGVDQNIMARRFSDSGDSLGPEFQLNSSASGKRQTPDLAELSGSGFVGVWQSLGQDGSGAGVIGRIFDSNGIAMGPEFQVNTTTAGQQQLPQVTAVPGGGFLVVFQGDDPGTGNAEVLGQLFNETGQKIGVEQQINSYSASVQGSPTVAVLADGSAVVTWQSNSQDGDGNGVFSQLLVLNQQTTGEVQIIGYPSEQQTLTAIADIDDANGVGTVSYTWYRDDVIVQESADNTYELGQSDVGERISVVVRHTDLDGFTDTLDQVSSDEITNVDNSTQGQPVITGQVQVGQVLVMDVTSIEDRDGISDIQYQWLVGESLLDAQTSSSLTLSEESHGQIVTGIVTVTDRAGNQEVFRVESTKNVQEKPRELLLAEQFETNLIFNEEPDALIRIDNNVIFSLVESEGGQTLIAVDPSTGAELDRQEFGPIRRDAYSSQLQESGSFGEHGYFVYEDPDWQYSKEDPAPNVYLRTFELVDGQIESSQLLLGSRDVRTTYTGYTGSANIFSHGIDADHFLISSSNNAYLIGDYQGVTSVVEKFSFVAQNDNINTNVMPLDGNYYLLGYTSSYTYGGTVGAQLRSTKSDIVIDIDMGDQSSSRYTGPPSISNTFLLQGEDDVYYFDFGKTTDPYLGGFAIQRVGLDTGVPEVLTSFQIGNGTLLQDFRDKIAKRIDPNPDYLGDSSLQSDGFYLDPTFIETEDGEYRVIIESYELNAAPEGQLALLGNATQGSTLLADAISISDDNGLTDFRYSWWHGGLKIEGAASETYTLSQNDVGRRIYAKVSYTDGEGRTEHVLSGRSDPVVNIDDPLLGEVIVTPLPDGRLQAYTRGLRDPDGLGEFSFQWLRNGAPIDGATGEVYHPTSEEASQRITVMVTFTDGGGTFQSAESGSHNSIVGTQSPDGLTGTTQDDALFGLNETDILVGVSGQDYLVGGVGNDWLSGEGTAAAAFGSTIANQVFRLYQSALDRLPDPIGHAAWSERLASGERTLQEVADGFVRSPQFRQTYNNLSNENYVQMLYNNVLDRAPDPAGLARWTSDLENGATRAEVLIGFSQSQQFLNIMRSAANNFILDDTASEWSDEVYRMYQATLDRAPDVQGFERWTGELAIGKSTLIEVADGFVRSPQFQATYENLSDTEFVTLLYDNVLDRVPDAGGLARWTGEMASGATRAEVVLGFSQSPQFTANTADELADWMRSTGNDDVLDAGAGDNMLFGGMLSDTFVFDAAQGGTHRVMDLEVWDTLDFQGFGYANDSDVRAHMNQVGSDVVFEDQGVVATFVGVDIGTISDAMIL